MMRHHPCCIAALVVAAFSAGCAVRDVPNYDIAPQINHMLYSKATESQTVSAVLPGGRSMLTPPEGTVRQGFAPVHYDVDEEGARIAGFVDEKGNAKLGAYGTAQAEKAGQELENPYKTSDDPNVLARGQQVFTTFCAPCHGKTGAGDGPVSKRGMPSFPLTLAGSAPTRFADGHIFHIVTYGRGMMASYATQISQDDRWKAIRWLRQLQQQAASGKGG